MKKTFKIAAIAAAVSATGTAHAIDVPPLADGLKTRIYGVVEATGSYELDQEMGRKDTGLRTAHGYLKSRDAAGGKPGPYSDIHRGKFAGTLNNSRLGVAARHENGLSGRVEVDFNDGTRLRHAYGQYGNWLVGQTWTNTLSQVGQIRTADVGVTMGRASEMRVPQLRYSSGPWSVSLEDADVGVALQAYSFYGSDTGFSPTGDQPKLTGMLSNDEVGRYLGDQLPEATAKIPALTVRFEDQVTDALTVAASGVVQRISSDTETTGNPVQTGPNTYSFVPALAGSETDDAVGFALFAASDFQAHERVTLHATAFYSDGANNFTQHTGGSYGGVFGAERWNAPDAVVDSRNGELETVESFGGSLGASIQVGPGVLGLTYGVARVKLEDVTDTLDKDASLSTVADLYHHSQSGWLTKRNETGVVNYAWEPVENLELMGELAYLKRTTQDNGTGEGARLMTTARFSF